MIANKIKTPNIIPPYNKIFLNNADKSFAISHGAFSTALTIADIIPKGG